MQSTSVVSEEREKEAPFFSLNLIFLRSTLAKVTGPSEDQLIENGGRGASMVALQALGM